VRPPSRRGVLAGGLGLAAAALVRSGAARAGSGRNLLVWWNSGGWDTTFALDPHFGGSIPNDPDAEPATTGDITWADAASRPSVRRFFDAYGARSIVINGIAVDSISHDACTRLMLTGALSERGTDLCAIVASETGSGLAVPHAVLSGPRFPGARGGIVSDVNATFSGILRDTLPADLAADPTQEAAIAAWLADEGDRLLAARERPQLRGWRDGLDRLGVLRAEAGALPTDDADPAQSQIDLAVTLLQKGLSRAVTIRAPRASGASWDSHADNNLFQDQAWEYSFANLLKLLDALAATPGVDGSLLDETVVLVGSEMSRSPVLNAAAGKDHWPYTSAVLLGGGIAGGRTLGATNDQFVGMPIDLATGAPSATGERLTSARLVAGLLAGFDLDPEAWLPGARPLTALFG
jgi:hypothetical protein